MKTLLYVEDEITILRNVAKALSETGYSVVTAENLAAAREYLSRETPDAVILDIMLPDGNGLELLKELRESGNKVPVIMLTAWGEPQDVARGLSLGANDYISKPFHYEVLLARVKAMFQNVEQMPESIERGAITLKIRPMELHFKDRKTKLPPVEFFMLQLFIEEEGKNLKTEYLYEKVWGADMINDPTAVRNTVSRLRKKIEGSGYTINAVYGGRYRFEKE